MRHMMQPFKPGDRLEDHATPISEVMQQLQTQLAEYRALKEQLATGAVGMAGRDEDSSNEDGSSSGSSSYFQLAP